MEMTNAMSTCDNYAEKKNEFVLRVKLDHRKVPTLSVAPGDFF